MTPALARDLGKVKGVMAAATKPSPPAAIHQAPTADAPRVQPEAPMCITHNLPIKFNAKGISMGGCEECRREIAAMGGHKAKIQLAMNPLERVFADHPKELEWLCSHAREQVRSPEGQLIYLCKQAMEAAV
jgi:hypothetical protein